MNENNDIQQFDFLDSIAVSAFILQILDYVLTLEQASNNDILQELKKDVKELRRENRELRQLIEERLEIRRGDFGAAQLL